MWFMLSISFTLTLSAGPVIVYFVELSVLVMYNSNTVSLFCFRELVMENIYLYFDSDVQVCWYCNGVVLLTLTRSADHCCYWFKEGSVSMFQVCPVLTGLMFLSTGSSNPNLLKEK